MADELLRIAHLSRHFGKNKAVEDVSLQIFKGEVLGLVGESGSGKTTTGRCIMGLYPLSAGTVFYKNQPIRTAGRKTVAMRRAAKNTPAPRIQMIFQDPMASLDPRMTVRESIAEGLVIQGIRDKAFIRRRVDEMLELVGLRPEYASRYPHEFSGGQRQRIGIARALIMDPELLIADEPVSALDVSVQAQVINLLSDLREKLGLTVLFIAHDLSVVKYFCHRIGVMHLGRLVEVAQTEELFQNPLHPYTKSLLSAIPLPDPRLQKGRKRIPYTPPPLAERSLQEIIPGHWVFCSDTERRALER